MSQTTRLRICTSVICANLLLTRRRADVSESRPFWGPTRFIYMERRHEAPRQPDWRLSAKEAASHSRVPQNPGHARGGFASYVLKVLIRHEEG